MNIKIPSKTALCKCEPMPSVLASPIHTEAFVYIHQPLQIRQRLDIDCITYLIEFAQGMFQSQASGSSTDIYREGRAFWKH